MNCPYCQTNMSDYRNSGVFSCGNHPVPTTFICAQLVPASKTNYIVYTQFRADPFHIIEICFYDHTTRLFVDEPFSMPNKKLITQLDYVPNDLSPETSAKWLKRLLELKVFA